jgi:hypothetical protein
MSQNTNVRAIEKGQKSSIWQAVLTRFEANANKMNCELMLTYDTPAYMFNVYKHQPSRQVTSFMSVPHIVGSVIVPIRFLLPVCRLCWFLYTLNIYVNFSSHFSQQILMAEI